MTEKSAKASLLNTAILIIGVAMVIYHLIAVFLSPLQPVMHAHTHLTFVLLMVFLTALQVAIQKKDRLDLWLLSISLLMSIGVLAYIYIFALLMPSLAATYHRLFMSCPPASLT